MLVEVMMIFFSFAHTIPFYEIEDGCKYSSQNRRSDTSAFFQLINGIFEKVGFMISCIQGIRSMLAGTLRTQEMADKGNFYGNGHRPTLVFLVFDISRPMIPQKSRQKLNTLRKESLLIKRILSAILAHWLIID